MRPMIGGKSGVQGLHILELKWIRPPRNPPRVQMKRPKIGGKSRAQGLSRTGKKLYPTHSLQESV